MLTHSNQTASRVAESHTSATNLAPKADLQPVAHSTNPLLLFDVRRPGFAADVLRLQQMAGNGTVTQMLRRSTPSRVLQRHIFIGSVEFKSTAKDVGILWTKSVVPALERDGYKTYGIITRLRDFIDVKNEAYPTVDAFSTAFLKWLATQVRPGKKGHDKPVLKKFEVMTMSRPAWPDELKEAKGYEMGDNIRHVVRNHTLLKALQVEWNSAPLNERKPRFLNLAAALGLAVAEDTPLDKIIKTIYKALYLNTENLFSGDALTNQIIGYASDSVREYGEDLMGGNGQVDPNVVYGNVMKAVTDAAAKLSGTATEKAEIIKQIDETVQNALASLYTSVHPLDSRVAAKEAGQVMAQINIDLNLPALMDESVRLAQAPDNDRRDSQAVYEFIMTEVVNEFSSKDIEVSTVNREVMTSISSLSYLSGSDVVVSTKHALEMVERIGSMLGRTNKLNDYVQELEASQKEKPEIRADILHMGVIRALVRGAADAHPLITNISNTVREKLKMMVSARPKLDLLVPARVAGELVADLGLNFGFDLIDGRVDEDRAGIAVRQARLVWSETLLQKFIAGGGGAPGDLAIILKVFMGQSGIPM